MSKLAEKLGQLQAEDLERVESCPLCGESDGELLFWNYDRVGHSVGRFGTIQCGSCGLIRLDPRPNPQAIGKYYPASYGAYTDPKYSIDLVSPRNRFGIRDVIRSAVLAAKGYPANGFTKLLGNALKPVFHSRATYGYGDRFPDFVPSGSALEIGCGNGSYLSYLKHHGWNVVGLDLSEHAAESAKKYFDIEVFVGPIEDAPFESESFDYVHMSHVVEHFFDPLMSMKMVHKLLKPGGRIYVEVPNHMSIGAKLSEQFWYGWDAPRHLFMFSARTMSKLLKDAGFRVEKMSTFLDDSFAWEIVFRAEEREGAFRPDRPALNEDESRLARERSEAARSAYQRDNMCGDFLSCWANKD